MSGSVPAQSGERKIATTMWTLKKNSEEDGARKKMNENKKEKKEKNEVEIRETTRKIR
jgi:hypothetical protein